MSEETTQTQAGGQDDLSAAMAKQGKSGAQTKPDADDDYERAAVRVLESKPGQLTTANANLDVILDIPVTLSMEIGRTEIPINSLLQLNQGSVVELDRLAGEPMDVLINGTLIAHGEVVVINEKFGIRLTDVISPAERVKKLK